MFLRSIFIEIVIRISFISCLNVIIVCLFMRCWMCVVFSSIIVYMVIVVYSELIYVYMCLGVCDINSIIVVIVDGLVMVGIVSGMMKGLLVGCDLVVFLCGKIICSVMRNSMMLFVICSDMLVRFIMCRKFLLKNIKMSSSMNVMLILCSMMWFWCLGVIGCSVEMKMGMLLSGLVISISSMVVEIKVYFIV